MAVADAPVTTEEYISNMGVLIKEMRSALAPNGTLIWSTTTPVPPSYTARNNSDVVVINAAMKALLDQPENNDIVQVAPTAKTLKSLSTRLFLVYDFFLGAPLS